MTRPLHLLTRKLKTFGVTVANCSNWLSIALAKVGAGPDPQILRWRDGFQLAPMPPLRGTWGEIFEPAIADLYNLRSSTPDLIIDVGANMGSFACRAAYLRPQARVHAFEPSQKHADLLERNARLNSLQNITLHRAPVTKDGREVIFSESPTGGSSGLFIEHENGPRSLLRSETLEVVDFSQSSSLFLKLDCEGAEGEIIEWVCEHAAKLPPKIQIAAEYHHWCPVPRDEILQHLRSAGFAAEAKTLFDEGYIFAARGRPMGVPD